MVSFQRVFLKKKMKNVLIYRNVSFCVTCIATSPDDIGDAAFVVIANDKTAEGVSSVPSVENHSDSVTLHRGCGWTLECCRPLW